MANIKYEIIEYIKVLSSKKDWNRELNLISWNEKKPKYDIRDWDNNHEKMGKGITISKEEILILKETLNKLNIS